MPTPTTFGAWMELRPGLGRQPDPSFYAECLEEAALVEELGLAAVWGSEHHAVEDGHLSQQLPFLAAVAARTSRIQLGTGVLLLPLYRPRDVAEQAGVVDLIAGGRLVLGLGNRYEVLRSALERARRSAAGFPIVIGVHLRVSDDPERTWATELGPGVAYQLDRYNDWATDRDQPRPQPIEAARLKRSAVLCDTADGIVAALTELQERLPFTHVALWTRPAGTSHEAARPASPASATPRQAGSGTVCRSVRRGAARRALGASVTPPSERSPESTWRKAGVVCVVGVRAGGRPVGGIVGPVRAYVKSRGSVRIVL